MLFPYKYINHSIEKLQEYLDHLFLEVWCKADYKVAFDVSLLHPELQAIINEIYYDATVPYGRYLYEPIGEVYKIFQLIDKASKVKLAWSYLYNNCIEYLCSQEAGYEPVTYDDLKTYHPDLPAILEAFYKNLYNEVLGLKIIKTRIGDLDDHYIQFVKENNEGKCPFCGINGIKGEYNSMREAYDHYLPKSIYPFNSVNFYNLSPMCHECNSTYKLAKDPLKAKPKKNPLQNKEGLSRKAFYSFASNVDSFQLQIDFLKNNIHLLTPDDIKISFLNSVIQEEIDTWKDIFGIEERYKAKCLEKNDGKYWFEQATDELSNAEEELGVTFTQEKWVQYQINAARRKPYVDGNFIKAEYLEACKRIGIL